jgi:branched-subunit amino acid transport protein AzlD
MRYGMMRMFANHYEGYIVFEATRSCNSFVHKHTRSIVVCLLAMLLVACQNAAAPAPSLPPTPTSIAFVPLDVLLKSNAAPPSGDLTTVGYLIVDRAGAALVDGLSFAADGTPQLLDNPSQIWLGPDIEANINTLLRDAGVLRFAPARVHGRLEGPGAYGPSQSYRYRLISPSIEVIAAQETTISDLLDHSASYENRLVRLVGSLITRDNSALLVDQLGAGGLPMPKARQIKLRAPLQDRALLGRLKGVSGGAIRFGPVQVEGFWRDGVLIPISIILVT